MKTKITQKEAIFYQLYMQRVLAETDEEKYKYIQIWKLIGEVFCPEVHLWGFVSYEVSARASEMFKYNTGLLERKYMRGKTGARYYGYRISINAKPSLIQDEKLLKFYQSIVKNKIHNEKRTKKEKDNLES